MNAPEHDSAAEDSSASAQAAPQAIVTSADGRASAATKLWWLTILCVIVAAVITSLSLRSPGLAIDIRFPDGHGLKVGDSVRYRGIDVGEVERIELSDDLKSVEASVMLSHGNESIAVEGTQFWIQRPRLEIGQFSGLETVIGSKYIGVLPGDPNSAPQTAFIGLSTPRTLSGSQWREITIRFPSGEGIGVGNPIRYRGIAVGEVTAVQLDARAESVIVRAQLVGTAGSLATAGTQFWIERPRLDLTEVRGLETLVGGRHIAMQPGELSAPEQDYFDGLASAPPLPRSTGSLEIELDADNRMGLVRGAPVSYRGLEVGRISNVGLSSDGASVKLKVIIEPEYTALVRENSLWWATAGMEVDAGLKGINLTIDSLESWIRGGVSFATPDKPGKQVVGGRRFMLRRTPPEKWEDWKPRIAVGDENKAVTGVPFPRAIRVVASWRGSMLSLYKQRSIQTWAVALDDGSIHVPSTFIDEVLEADSPATIELAGEKFPFKPSPHKGGLKTVKIVLPRKIDVAQFPAKELSQEFNDQSVFLVVNPELSQPIALDHTRVGVEKGIGLLIAPGIPLAPELLGSPVVSSRTGKLYGLLLKGEKSWFIAAIR
ncbi:MAG: hypothetical protein Aurels2KO_05360 [Aureliella sp.]